MAEAFEAERFVKTEADLGRKEAQEAQKKPEHSFHVIASPAPPGVAIQLEWF
jgi:hypothetical protein